MARKSKSLAPSKRSGGKIKDPLNRVTKPAKSNPRRNTAPEQPVAVEYGQPDGLTGEKLFADLKKSYAETVPVPPPVRVERQERWQYKGSNPITNPDQAPAGWNDEEPDLHPEDWDAQIARCKERIEDGIMPAVFEWKLQAFLKEKANQDAMMAAEPLVKDWSVVQRLTTLKGMLAWLKDGNDKYNLAPNVVALIEAYRSGSLKWHDGLVSYFSNGKRISQPRRFIYEEFEEIAAKYNGQSGFWVEGLFGVKPRNLALNHMQTDPHDRSMGRFYYPMKLCLRLTGSPAVWHEFKFIDDTGADTTVIPESDVNLLLSMGAAPPMIVSLAASILADGRSCYQTVIAMEVNLYTQVPVLNAAGVPVTGVDGTILFQRGTEMMNWTSVLVSVIPVNQAQPPSLQLRLNGPFLRHRLYTATAPDGVLSLHMFDGKGKFNERVPKANGRRTLSTK
ncbi:hypothetical protein N7457_000625 [Penicillium paradoxum]|uniref:uncharacterized protein n=1 Tax=Penicillium paradoxum TaxID=176176 RepID=UPI002549B54F|nr:uncharacterized protein N7457_000625 [Penicillium paradoxum]KAJ5794026.1 hypothetical protein N7457_000625 [Penicillium paradoxum]